MHNSNPLICEYIKNKMKKIMNRSIPIRRESIKIKFYYLTKPNRLFYSI